MGFAHRESRRSVGRVARILFIAFAFFSAVMYLLEVNRTDLFGDKDGKEKDGKKQSKAARLEELNQLRLELDLKEIQVREKTQELVKQEQTSAIIQEELELARKLNAILQQELDRVKEETKLASGLCAQVGGF